MSDLSEMNKSLKRLKRAKDELKAACDVFHKRFRVGSRAVFDRGDMKMVRCVVVQLDAEMAIVIADTPSDLEGPGMCLLEMRGRVYVPFALLFTPEAAAEMAKLRSRLLKGVQHGS